MADDLVAGAVAELYGADPDAFTERRKALAAAAREAGDRAAATAIGGAAQADPVGLGGQPARPGRPGAPARLAALAADAAGGRSGPRTGRGCGSCRPTAGR